MNPEYSKFRTFQFFCNSLPTTLCWNDNFNCSDKQTATANSLFLFSWCDLIANHVHALLPPFRPFFFRRLWCCNAIRSQITNHTHMLMLFPMFYADCNPAMRCDRKSQIAPTNVKATPSHLFFRRCDIAIAMSVTNCTLHSLRFFTTSDLLPRAIGLVCFPYHPRHLPIVLFWCVLCRSSVDLMSFIYSRPVHASAILSLRP